MLRNFFPRADNGHVFLACTPPGLHFPCGILRTRSRDCGKRAVVIARQEDDTRYIDHEIGDLELPSKRNRERELTFVARVRSLKYGGETKGK